MARQSDIPKKAPDPYNLRLVKVLSGEDGIGRGIGNINESYGTYYGDIKERLAMLADGGLVVADPAERRLKVFDREGILMTSFVCRKNIYDAPLSPDMIAVDTKNRIIVADKSRGLVFILDTTGKFIRDFKVEKGESDPITDMYVTSQGNIIVVTSGYHDHYLSVFNPTGSCLGETELSGDRWFFSNDRVLSDGILYDFTNMDPKKHQAVVRKDMRKTLGGTTCGFAVDDKGRMYVRYQGPIIRYDTSGKETELVGRHLGYDVGDMFMLGDNQIAFSRGGSETSIWDGRKLHDFDGVLLTVIGRTAIACRMLRTNGRYHATLLKIATPDTVQALFEMHASGVVSVATDTANRIIVGDHGCVRVLNPNGNIEKTITRAGHGAALEPITAVTVDHENNIFATDYRGDMDSDTESIHMFDANGVFVESNTGNGFRGKGFGHMVDMLESYRKMARDSHGRIISNDFGSVTIRDSSGTDVKRISVHGAYHEGIKFAGALTVDKWDRIIAVEAYMLTIRIFDHAGNLVRAVRGTAVGGKKLEKIYGVAADGMGRIIISGRDENGVVLIQVFGTVRKPKKRPVGISRNVSRNNDPLHILQVRYAKGELTDEQFESMKKKLA